MDDDDENILGGDGYTREPEAMEDENEYGDEEWDEAEASTTSSAAAIEREEPVETRHEAGPAAAGNEDDAESEQAYESEWSEQESPARGNCDAVHPLSTQISKTVDDPTGETDATVYQQKANKISSQRPADDESHTSNEYAARKATKMYSDSIVQSHAQRVRTNSSSTQRRELRRQQMQSVDWGAEGARIAAERIRQFRELARLQDEQQKLAHTIQQQQRQQYRTSNKAMHEALGVANISPQQRLEMLQREQRKQRKKRTDAAQVERRERWYNRPDESGARVPRCMAAAHVSNLNKRELHLQRGKQKVQEDRKREIHENLMRLQNRARFVIAKSQGAYVNGSYLLRRSHNQTLQPKNAVRGDQSISPQSVGCTTTYSLECDDQPVPVSDTMKVFAPIISANTVQTATDHSDDECVELESSASESAFGVDTQLDNVATSSPTYIQAPSPVAPAGSAKSLMVYTLSNDDDLVQSPELNRTAPTEAHEPTPTISPENSMAGGMTNHDDAQMPSDSSTDSDVQSPPMIVSNEKIPDLSMSCTEIRDATPLEPRMTNGAEFLSEFLEPTTSSPAKSAVDVDPLTDDDDGMVSESFDYADDFTT